jgi:hypothetical protein
MCEEICTERQWKMSHKFRLIVPDGTPRCANCSYANYGRGDYKDNCYITDNIPSDDCVCDKHKFRGE